LNALRLLPGNVRDVVKGDEEKRPGFLRSNPQFFRFFGRSIVHEQAAQPYEPIAQNIHAIDERVSLSSLQCVTKTIALFAAA
jgi:acetylornithine deacetylase/succinyl-diaminopimelate desuccinylase-like protein